MLTDAELLSLPESIRAKVEAVALRLNSADARIRNLEDKIRLLLILKYGPSSEKLKDAQLDLLESEPGVTPREVEQEAARPEGEKQAAEKINRRRPQRGAFTLPADLQREEEIIPCLEKDCTCPICQGERVTFGYEVTERLHRIPASYVVKVLKREKRACPQCEEGGVKTAPLPAQIISKGIASNELVVDIVVSKYAMHLPLYRQEMQIARDCGVLLTRQTMCGWVMEVGFLLGAIRREMIGDLIEGRYIQADETPIGVQSDEPKGRNHKGYLWEYSRPQGPVVFDYQNGRGREGPLKILHQFKGTLQTDEYAVYESLRLDGVALAGCMAHARRKFVEAAKIYTQDTSLVEILTGIGSLYEVERQAREEQLNHAQRLELRQEKSVKTMATLKDQITRLRQGVLPQSLQAKACDYALGLWNKLEVYLTDGQIEIDNNWCENAIRPVAIGRKNWLHFGSKEAGPNIAAILSVVETCHRLKISVREYLLDVLPKLATGKTADAASLTPIAWKAARSQPGK